MEPETIARWSQEKQVELQAVDRQLEPLLRRREALQKELRLLDELYDQTIGGESAPETDYHPVTQAAYEVLREAEGALTAADLYDRVRESRPHAIPGRGDKANLLVWLPRDPRIIKLRRGVYDLAERHIQQTA